MRPNPEDVVDWIERWVSIQNPAVAATGIDKIPFTLTPAQRRVALTAKAFALHPRAWLIACKSRQVGFSTLCLAWALALMIMVPGITIAFVSPEETLKGPLAAKWSIIWRSAAAELGRARWPGVASDNPSEFSLCSGSRLVWVSAGGDRRAAKKAGIGETIAWCVFSELASYSYGRETLAAIEPALNLSGASVVVDSTPPQAADKDEIYTELAKEAADGHPTKEFFFWAWWEEARNRAGYPAQALTEEEMELAKRHGLDLYQLAWRRERKASKSEGPTFGQTYLETVQEALNPRADGYAFAPAVIAKHMGRTWRDYPAPLSTGDLWPLVPHTLKREHHGGDLLFSAKWGEPAGEGYVRVWRPPVHGVRYYAGLDPSKGLSYGDWQLVVVLDEWDRHCATIRTRISVARFAALTQRVCTWFGALLEIEMTSTGPEIALFLVRSVDPDEARRMRAFGLEPPFRRIIQRTGSAANKSSRISTYHDKINSSDFEIVDPDMFAEILTIDPSTGRCRRAEIDHDDYLDGLGIAADNSARDRARGAAPSVTVSSAPRERAAAGLARK